MMRSVAGTEAGHRVALAPLTALGLLFGFVMPLVAALVYPSWTHEMHPGWLEYTRVMEAPFVLCELGVILWALKAGMRDADTWRALPRDCRWALVLFGVGLTAGSVFLSRNPLYSVTLSVVTVIHLRFAGAVWFLARLPGGLDGLDGFVPLLGAGLGLLAVLTACRFAFPPPAALVPGGVIEWPSAMPGFISVRHLGSWTGAVAAGLMVSLLYGDADGRRRDAEGALYLVAAGFTVWTGTRAAILAMVVVAAVALLTLRRLPPRDAIGRVALLSAAALVLAWVLLPADPTFALFAQGDAQSANVATGGRLELWSQTYHRWLASPLLGWGSGSTFWEVYIGWSHTQPHNFVLQALISWGLVGAAGAFWLLGRAMLATYAVAFRDPGFLPLAGTVCSLLFMSLLEGMLHYPRFIEIILLGLAVVLARREAGSNRIEAYGGSIPRSSQETDA